MAKMIEEMCWRSGGEGRKHTFLLPSWSGKNQWEKFQFEMLKNIITAVSGETGLTPIQVTVSFILAK